MKDSCTVPLTGLICLLLALPLSAQKTPGGGRPSGGSGGLSGGKSSPNQIGNSRQPGFNSGRSIAHASDENPVEFQSETILVQVPVVVTDKSGTHVSGLNRTDFKVYENGSEKSIASFEEIEASHAALAAPPPRSGEFSNLSANGSAAHSITVIALDTINTPFLDQTYGRKQLVKYLAENVNSGQVFAVVAIGGRGTRIIHNLTTDPAELVKALNKLNGELPALQGVDIDVQAAASAGTDAAAGDLTAMASPEMVNTEDALQSFLVNGEAPIARLQQDRAVEITMRSFLDVAWLLSGIPGRKSLIWATAGFPFILDSPSAVPGGRLSALYERTMQALNDSQISVYPVDVRGLVNFSPISDASAHGPRGSAAMASSLAARSWLHTSTLDTLKDFADMTGGRAFYNTNDLAGSFRRAAEDSSSYYLLSYYLDTKNSKPGWRQLKVKVDKSKVEVRSRNGFLVTNATMNPELSKQSDMNSAFSSPFDSTGVPLTVQWKNMATDGEKKKVQFGLHVLPEGISTEGPANRIELEVGFVALPAKGGSPADQFDQTIQSTPKPETLAQIRGEGLTYNNNLELAAGQYVVRFVVRDNFSGKVGSVSAPLTVN